MIQAQYICCPICGNATREVEQLSLFAVLTRCHAARCCGCAGNCCAACRGTAGCLLDTELTHTA